ncbi:MAG: hypothetical protein GEU28_10490 [Dehalococcoidia bacterium]|nr:hypothetical protein [Dehalococcoidia bacterium]
MSARSLTFAQRWFQPVPAARLALLRVAVGAYAVVYLVVRFSNLVSYAGFEANQFEPVGPVAALSEPVPDLLVYLLALAAVASGLAFTLGWRFAVSGPIFAVLLLWVISYRNSFGQVFHTENLMVLAVLIVALAPAADAFSLDERCDARGRGSTTAIAMAGLSAWSAW